MGFDTLVRNGVALADRMTTDLQVTIQIYPWIGTNDNGGPLYGSAVSMKAIVEEKEITRRLSTGQEVTQQAEITIPRPVAANGATERREPIDPRDKILLPSGLTGPILDVNGMVDPTTNQPYMFTVILGWRTT
jgi:hypothetical protein